MKKLHKTTVKMPLLLFLITILSLYNYDIKAQFDNTKIGSLIDLNRKGLEQAKAAFDKGNTQEATQKILEYYQNRTGIIDPSINLNNIQASAEDFKKADEALEHKLYAHKGFQPSFFYGKDIDWTYWPVKDHELRFQLHRHSWFSSMGRVFRKTGDEKYAKEWVFQYLDWIKKNPLIEGKKTINGMSVSDKDLENESFAWRPLEACGRIPVAGQCLEYFKKSQYFTPDFLMTFLSNVDRHAEYITRHYSERGNHLLFEAQYVLYAGIVFPELKNSAKWRASGIDILTRELQKQVYQDGFQWELDLGYHLGAIHTFFQSLELATINGYKDAFPKLYLDKIEKMIIATINSTFPDNTSPHFSDARAHVSTKQFQNWEKYFPENEQIAYMASDGKRGKLPPYLSRGFKDAGFFTFRNGWSKDATVMVLKAGPPAAWHNQPDNGTFDLYIKGRNFFPDGGSFVYGGDEETMKERNWFRQTMVHKTLTLNNKNIENTNSKCLFWKTDNNLDVLVTENQSYADLKHRRSVFFVDKQYFVIIDETIGNATGKVGIHYQYPSETSLDLNSKNTINTQYQDNNNVCLKVFGQSNMKMVEEEGWISKSYRVKEKRPAFGFEIQKNTPTSTRFITVIAPFEKIPPKIEANFINKKIGEKAVGAVVKIQNKTFNLSAEW
ncbi:heparin-sulfate lyase HepC [Arcicella rosea]|uniref:Heparan-sulfate lyase n=1 Tax=Arcicella rosea TaxID=502909 RepID=A0A841EH98_9BACT|nr:heparin-sulfate lyase HepC [Arcicella rosea]MBB6002535.1 heparan-sulfate lyase [Arcicella rosea]